MRDIGKYDVFILADELVLKVYRQTRSFPKEEVYGLTSQMRRAASSIPMNLAEGGVRPNSRDFARFVNVAMGSCEELRYQIRLAGALGYLPSASQADLETGYEKVKQMLTKLWRAALSDKTESTLEQVQPH